jgi:hypothetical protein
MSNVLIGIIGVILFIGLAIAGTTILGSDFMTASSSVKATAVSAHLQQFAQGTQVLKVRRGVFIPGSIGASLGSYLISNKALEEIPVNPMVTGNPYIGADATGSGGSSSEIRIVYTDIGAAADRKAHDVCYAIEEQAGNTNPATVVDSPTGFPARAAATQRLGCMLDADYNNHYVAYIFL